MYVDDGKCTTRSLRTNSPCATGFPRKKWELPNAKHMATFLERYRRGCFVPRERIVRLSLVVKSTLVVVVEQSGWRDRPGGRVGGIFLRHTLTGTQRLAVQLDRPPVEPDTAVVQ